MAVIKQYRIYRSDLQNNPNILFLFGDNTDRQGYGGQAGEMRDEPNAVGIRTCAFCPSWHKRDFKEHITMIGEDLVPVWRALGKGKTVVIPEEGLGTGIANLKQFDPYAFYYLETTLALMASLYPIK